MLLAAVAIALAGAGLMIVPDTIRLWPRFLRDHPLEWLCLGLVIAFQQARSHAQSRPLDDPGAVRLRGSLARLENLSGRALNGGFTVALAILIIILLASWIPHYLTWPWCRDEDTFATLAQSWDAGIRPYRDIRAYNFPGHIYLHWLLGKVLGWGHTAPFYAVDASAVLGLGVALVFWSRRRLGGWLPGLLSFVAFLQFYLSREYEQVAERDWHATLAAVLAIMTLEAWPQRPAVWLAAALEAAAVTIRPHAIFFLPAIASALMERRRPRRGLAEWGLAFTAFVALAFAPLVIDGLLDDLIRGLRVAAYGGPYSKASLTVAREALESSCVIPGQSSWRRR